MKVIARGLVFLCGLLSVHAIGQDISSAQWDRLKNGEILIEDVVHQEGIHGAKVSYRK